MILRLVALLLLICNIANAQLPNISFEHISDNDGLPSRTVQSAIEDADGFMWFGTRRCLTRYDGYSFRNVGDRWVHGLATDSRGTVYYSSASDRLIKIDPYSKKETSIVGLVEGGGNNTFIDSFGDIWFSDRECVNRYDPANGKLYVYPMRKTTFIFHKGSFVEDRDKNVWVLGMEVGLFKFDRKHNKLICKMGLDCPPTEGEYELKLHRGFVDEQNTLWAALAGDGILKYEIRTGRHEIFRHKNFSMYTVCPGEDEQGKPFIWLGSDSGLGIFRPETGEFSFFNNLIPRKYGVYDIVLSKKTGIVWICTSEGVLKYDPANQFVKTNQLSDNQRVVSAILKDRSDPAGQTFWMAVSHEGLYKWNLAANQTSFYPFPRYQATSEVTWLIQDKNNRLWIGCNQWQTWADGKSDISDNRFEGIFQFDISKEKFVPTPFDLHRTFFSVPFYSLGTIDSKGRFWLINHYESIHVFDPKKNKEIKLWNRQAHDQIFAGGNWVMHVFEDSRSRIWLATYRGIFLYDEKAKSFHKIETDYGLIHMAEGPDGNLWAVGWPGLIKLDQNGKILKTWSKKDGLYDIECRRVYVDKENRVWIGTFDGLHVFDEKTNTFCRFTINEGLLSNNTMFSICATDGNKLLIGNVGGWNTLDIAKLDKTKAISNIQLSNVRINNKESAADWTKPVILEPEENAVSFDFSVLNFRKANDNHYDYYLEGFEKDWVYGDQEHEAFYTNLAPGKYSFHARAAGIANGHALKLPFEIKPKFYQTWWFLLLSFLLIIGAVGFIYQNQLSYQTIKAKLELEELTRLQKEAKHNEELAAYQLRLSETEMASLRSQMNPHFIFNCLNSIQFFTAQNDGEKASDYLNKFSRLIRLVLENSKSEQVTLENELETLRLYIEMETMRFPQKLHFQIKIDDEIEIDSIQIPPLLLQPFVENAIWHGLMHKETGGTVSVVLSQPIASLLRVEILDDGIGRQKASEFKSKSATKSKSFGMKITADRIELINQLFHIKTNVQIMDLTDHHGEALGTKVILNIPV